MLSSSPHEASYQSKTSNNKVEYIMLRHHFPVLAFTVQTCTKEPKQTSIFVKPMRTVNNVRT